MTSGIVAVSSSFSGLSVLVITVSEKLTSALSGCLSPEGESSIGEGSILASSAAISVSIAAKDGCIGLGTALEAD